MKLIYALLALMFTTTAFALPVFTPELVVKNRFGETSVFSPQPGTNFVAAFKAATVTLTAAQVIAANVTPIQLVAAKAGYLIQVVGTELIYTKSTAFTVTASKHLILQYHTSAVQISSLLTTGFIDQATSKTAFSLATGSGGVGIGGQAVEIISDDSGIAAGTGSTVQVIVYYNLLKVI